VEVPRLFVDLRPLRESRNFRLLILGQMFSLLGSNLTLVAVPYQVYRETHSSLWVGLASLVQLPFLITGALWGGAYGDRYDRRVLLMLGSLLCALASTGLALNALSAHGRLVALLSLAALSAGAGGFTNPIRGAAIPGMLRPDQLISAYSINQIIFNFAAVVGPALAGVLLAAVSLSSCYWIDAVTFLGLVLAAQRMSPLVAPAGREGAALWRAIADGLAYVRQHALAQAVYLADLNANVFGLPRALFPAMALVVYHGGPRTLGLLYAAPAAGALVMAVVAGWINHVSRRGRTVIVVIAAWGVAMALFGVVHLLWFGLLALAVAGSMDMVSAVLRSTILQLAITDEFRGRIQSIQMAVTTGSPRLGDAEAGVVAALTSTEFSIVSGGIACIIGVAVLAWRRPDFWNQSVER